jgi:hypothetical protein
MIPNRKPLNVGDADHGLGGRHSPRDSGIELRGGSAGRQIGVPSNHNLQSLAEKTIACAHGS